MVVYFYLMKNFRIVLENCNMMYYMGVATLCYKGNYDLSSAQAVYQFVSSCMFCNTMSAPAS